MRWRSSVDVAQCGDPGRECELKGQVLKDTKGEEEKEEWWQLLNIFLALHLNDLALWVILHVRTQMVTFCGYSVMAENPNSTGQYMSERHQSVLSLI
ncbi:hypothetical protein scyTo_0018899 [Scyliorhinus torazame]|uniref:Uncharacterized protein n=1 Tax=Scyliorhinus torazame TaxID=75743 RepID=A0A401Q4A4_SCYTO|nr:hypothetical protein [Scyliorhinus torazame]